jgi:hypothetical protein
VALTTARLVAILCMGAPVMVTATEGSTAAEVAVCNTIQQGDTAAMVSWRMTGSAQEYQPWFQILDAQSRVVPKSQYRWVHAGWRACVPWSRRGVAWNREERSTTANDVAASGGVLHAFASVLQAFALSVAAGAWWGVGFFVVMLLALDGWQYARRRRVIVGIMQRFGERFVSEFERPLRMPGSEERPVESQLRLIPRRQRLEILLAPAGRRRYPNLSDHRSNVTYDAERIVLLLKEERFAGGQLRGHGKWVVIACDFKIRPGQKGHQ